MKRFSILAMVLVLTTALMLSGCNAARDNIETNDPNQGQDTPGVADAMTPGRQQDEQDQDAGNTGNTSEDSGDTEDSGNDTTMPEDDNTEINVSTTELTSNNEKMFKMLSLLMADNSDKNVMISPLSINMAIQLVMNGMTDECRAEYESYYGKTLDELNSENKALTEKYSDGSIANIANSVWIRNDLMSNLNSDVNKAVTDSFDSEIHGFDTNDVSPINSWVSEKTHKMINKIVDRLDADTASILMNAIYFKGEWWDQFEDHQVNDEKFTLKDGTTVDVEMMSESGNSMYLTTDGVKGFSKGYTNGCSFIAILPDDESSFDITTFDLNKFMGSTYNPGHPYELSLKIPKFESSFDTRLNDMMDKMGIGKMYGPGSLGKLVDGHPDIYVSEGIHKTAIKMNESGTEASAVTAFVTKDMAMLETEEPEIVEVFLDRPFYYAIVDEDGVVLFVGYMQDPTLSNM